MRLRLPLATPQNSVATEVLLFFCRRRVPVLSKLVRILYNSDIYCRLPSHIYIPHPYGIVMHPQAAIGERVTVMQQVAIGDKDQGESVAPVIGNDVYIGAGARVLGDVRIGDGVTIGANAVVTRDIPPGVTVVGANRIVETTARSGGVRSVTPLPISMQRGA
jgi:serine O-acetyltransferase